MILLSDRDLYLFLLDTLPATYVRTTPEHDLLPAFARAHFLLLLLPTLVDLGSLGHRSFMDGLIEGKVEPNDGRK